MMKIVIVNPAADIQIPCSNKKVRLFHARYACVGNWKNEKQ